MFNPARNAAYVTHHRAGKSIVIDTESYKISGENVRYADSSAAALSADSKTFNVE